MNILILTTHLNIGGIPKYVINLVKGLSLRHNVFVASSGGEWESVLDRLDCKLIRISLKTKFLFSLEVFKAFFIIRKFLKYNRIDVIHANTRVSQMVAFLIWKSLGIPYVSTFHGYYRFNSGRKLIKLEGIQTIAISGAVKRHLVSDLKIPLEKINCVYNGVDFDGLKFIPDNGCLKYGLVSNPVIGIVARLSKEKNHKLLIESFSLLINDFPSAVLAIIGKGRMEDELKMLADTKGLRRKVVFIKDVSSEDILPCLDVFVLPSLEEGFGFSVVEAQYAGVPVVVSGKGGLPEIVKDKETGLVLEKNSPFALCSALKQILSNQELRGRITAKAKKEAEDKFSIKLMAENTEQVYKKAVYLTKGDL